MSKLTLEQQKKNEAEHHAWAVAQGTLSVGEFMKPLGITFKEQSND